MFHRGKLIITIVYLELLGARGDDGVAGGDGAQYRWGGAVCEYRLGNHKNTSTMET